MTRRVWHTVGYVSRTGRFYCAACAAFLDSHGPEKVSVYPCHWGTGRDRCERCGDVVECAHGFARAEGR